MGFASLSRALSEASRRNGNAEDIDKDLQQAVTQFTKFLNLVPALPPGTEPPEDEEEPEIRRESVLLQRSAAFLALGEEAGANGTTYYQNAVADADAAIAEVPEMPDGYFQKGMALRLLKDFPGAIASFSEVLGINPISYQALLRRGVIYYRLNELESAIADLEKAIQYAGGVDSRAHFWMAVCLASQDNHRDASVHYSKAIRYNPSLTTAYFNRGLSHLQIGRLTRAKSDFNEVLRRDPENQVARDMRDKVVELQLQ